MAGTGGVAAQTIGPYTVTFNLTLTTPEPSCTLSGASTLSFGTHERSVSGSGSASVSSFRTFNAGGITLTGTDVSSFTVSVSLPSAFPDVDVDLDLDWGESSTGSSYTDMGASTTYNGTAGGLWTDLTHYFAFKGTAEWDWPDITTATSDRVAIDITATCN